MPPPQQTTPAATPPPSSSNPPASSTTSRLVIPSSAPAGLITITQPAQTAVSYYKIAPNQILTFGWNFSYILATPTHLTVSAVCDNGNTYPVGPTDGVIPGTATSVTWDLNSYQLNNPTPLAQDTYTLHIWDDRGPGAPRAPGYLQENSALKFALYTPQAYTPLTSGWTCTTCSGSVESYVAHPAFVLVLTTFIVMFLSGFNLLRHVR